MELKPCPFCGGEAKIKCVAPSRGADEFSKIFIIACANCKVESPYSFRVSAIITDDGTLTVDETSKDKAIEKWNRRA